MKKHLKAALVQKAPVYFNMAGSLELARTYIQRAASEAVDLLVFPETWLCGYPVWLDYAPESGIWDHPAPKILYRLLCENALSQGDSSYRKLSELAAEAGIMIVMGAHELKGRSLYNSMFYFHPDGSSKVHRKLIPTYTERLIWARGDGSTLNSTVLEGWNIGGLICWEHWMPEARAYMHSLHEHIHIAQWPAVKEMHQVGSRHYAFEGQCFVLASGCTVTTDDLTEACDLLSDPGDREILQNFLAGMGTEKGENLLNGGSTVYGPDGTNLTGHTASDNDWITVSLDFDLLSEGSLYLDTSGHYARPDIFRLSVDKKEYHSIIHHQESTD